MSRSRPRSSRSVPRSIALMADPQASAKPYRFKSVLQNAGGGGAVVQMPNDVSEAMGGRKQFRVTGTVNGVPMKSSTFPYAGEGLWLGIHKATREKAGADFGDELEIEIVRDDAPR